MKFNNRSWYKSVNNTGVDSCNLYTYITFHLKNTSCSLRLCSSNQNSPPFSYTHTVNTVYHRLTHYGKLHLQLSWHSPDSLALFLPGLFQQVWDQWVWKHPEKDSHTWWKWLYLVKAGEKDDCADESSLLRPGTATQCSCALYSSLVFYKLVGKKSHSKWEILKRKNGFQSIESQTLLILSDLAPSQT